MSAIGSFRFGLALFMFGLESVSASPLMDSLNIRVSSQIVDNTGLWTAADQIATKQTFDAVIKDVKIDFRVMILRSLQSESLFDVTTTAFELLGAGDKTGNRGVLLIVAVEEKRVRLQVSKSLEPIFTDAFIGYIERNQMVPYFDRSELHAGIHATIELAVKRAYDSLKLNPEQIKQEDGNLESRYRTGGGGASAQFGNAAAPSGVGAPKGELLEYGAQPTPELAWRKFYQLHENKVLNPKLEIFDDRAKEMAKRYTTASLDFVAKLYANKNATVRQEGDRAVILFLDDPNFELAPWFFRKSEKGWQLDGSAYPGLIKYNHLNQWHFAVIDHPYTFAFRDYSINLNGYATSPSGLIQRGSQAGTNQPARRRGWIGASFTNAQRVSQYLSTKQDKGVVLYEILPDGAASKAGLEEGDVVSTFNGRDIVGHTHFQQLVGTSLEGEVIELEIIRGLATSDFPMPFDTTNTLVRPMTKGKSPPSRMKLKVTLLGSRDGK